MIIFTKFFTGTFFYNFIVMLINLVQKSTFPCFIEFMLYFYHFFIVCYYHLFNQRLLEHYLRKSFISVRIYILLLKMIKTSQTIQLCYKSTLFLSVIKFLESSHSQFSNLNIPSFQI